MLLGAEEVAVLRCLLWFEEVAVPFHQSECWEGSFLQLIPTEFKQMWVEKANMSQKLPGGHGVPEHPRKNKVVLLWAQSLSVWLTLSGAEKNEGCVFLQFLLRMHTKRAVWEAELNPDQKLTQSLKYPLANKICIKTIQVYIFHISAYFSWDMC